MKITIIILSTLLTLIVIGIYPMWRRLTKRRQIELAAETRFNIHLEFLQKQLTKEQAEFDAATANFERQKQAYNQQITNWKVEAAASEATSRMEAKAETDKLKNALALELAEFADGVEEQKETLNQQLTNYRQQIDGLLEPMLKLEKAEADKRFYCLALSQQDNEDMRYLIEEVAQKLTNSALIPKLCWSEYVSKAFTDLALKTDIKDEPGIYKITNINTNKCYIGKATNCKKRLADHLKGACGITTVADQVIHHAIVNEGFNNWTFEVICYCDKEQLNEREKFYIGEFHSQAWGYNRNAGGGG